MAREADTNIGRAKKRIRDRFRKLMEQGVITYPQYSTGLIMCNEMADEFEQIVAVNEAVSLAVLEQMLLAELPPGNSLRISA